METLIVFASVIFYTMGVFAFGYFSGVSDSTDIPEKAINKSKED